MPQTNRSVSNPPSEELVLEVARDEVVFREGDLGTEMFVLRQGQIEIVREVNGEEKTIAVLEKGDFFGEMSLLEELPRNATARALTDVKLIEINRAMFDRMLRANPEIGVRIMRKLSRRVRETDELLRQALSGDGEAVVAPPAEAAPEPPTTERTRTPESLFCWLTHVQTGLRFEVDLNKAVTVGRVDPVTGIQPEVDLSAVDTERSSSRRHAKMYREGDDIFVVEEIGTLNGTFVNSTRLQTAVPSAVNSGDTLRFGLVDFTFEVRRDD